MSETQSPLTDLDVSVVVPAYNAAETLGACLDALEAAGFARHTICVVDDGSTDATAQIAERHGVHLIRSAQAGAAAARNLGAAEGQAAVILFVDADVAVHGDVLDRLTAAFGADGCDAVFGSYDARPHRTERFSRLRNLFHHHTHQAGGGPVASFWTGLGAVRRPAFEAVGGFDPGQSMLEDVEFGARLHRAGYRTLLDPAMQGTHWKYWSLRGMIRTDLWDRAVPWAKLLIAGKASDTLNVSPRGKISVLGAGLCCLALGLAWFAPAMAVAMFGCGLAVLAGANWSFVAMIRRLDGVAGVVPALAMLLVHFTCGGLGYALVRLRLV